MIYIVVMDHWHHVICPILLLLRLVRLHSRPSMIAEAMWDGICLIIISLPLKYFFIKLFRTQWLCLNKVRSCTGRCVEDILFEELMILSRLGLLFWAYLGLGKPPVLVWVTTAWEPAGAFHARLCHTLASVVREITVQPVGKLVLAKQFTNVICNLKCLWERWTVCGSKGEML